MFAPIQSFFLALWRMWAGLFSAIPYGETYVATTCLVFVVFCIGFRLYTYKMRQIQKREWGDQFDRAELYKQVQNLR